MWWVDWSTNLHAVAYGGHGFSLKIEHLNPVNTWRPCIKFHDFYDRIYLNMNMSYSYHPTVRTSNV
jgi:hypothetical protein